ncbi:hypothetical protein M408DRAFT_60486 [Serendipita vermifera MAFF 305830]|uniref:C2H2-type domain-containing protein n=1 Tax=Serendipita vermifera MAFF 305830 TaxID=933852 RepID=A0A0C3BAC3_SERVB|nr:hypothetical protein M408DRAFT_60486 [Serendipita vermifera MAFF 305830]
MTTVITNIQHSIGSRGIKRKRAGGIQFTPAHISEDTPFAESNDESQASDLYESDGSVSEASDEDVDLTPRSQKKRQKVEGPLELDLKSTKIKYKCTFEGCQKAYTKPARLEEHKRSHTGERPFKCQHPGCDNSYLRDSHLQAHARTHRAYSERPFVCTEEECEKRFWTSTQLNIHRDTHDRELKPFKCTEGDCTEAFMKHNQLRAHFASAHCPPGTKNLRCEHEGCSKSFSTSQKLKAHIKVHQENRYACTTEQCLMEPQYFQTWSLLQAHIQTAHPPTCPHPGCERKFTSQKNFKVHLKIHEERKIQGELEDRMDCDESNDEVAPSNRRATDVGREWNCDWEGCEKSFKSKRAMKVHINVSHREERNFKCDHQGCEKAFGYKHLLQRHMAKIHGVHSGKDGDSPAEVDAGDVIEMESIPEKVEPSFIELLTGKVHKRRAEQLGTSTKSGKNPSKPNAARRILQCPWPHFSSSKDDGVEGGEYAQQRCEAVFHRAYDLRRHLKADHAFSVEKEELSAWLAHNSHS